MKCKIQTKRLKAILSAVKPISREITIDASNGWKISAVDAAHVAMLRVDAVPNYFEEFSSNEGDIFTIDLEKLTQTINFLKDDNVELDTEKKDGRLSWTSGTMSGTLGLSSKVCEVPKVPKLDLPAQFGVTKANLAMASKVGASITDFIILEAASGKLVLSSSDDSDEFEMSVPTDYKGEKVRSAFPLDYFDSIVKACPGDDLVISMGTDHPVKIAFGDGEKFELSGFFALAPRIERD